MKVYPREFILLNASKKDILEDVYSIEQLKITFKKLKIKSPIDLVIANKSGKIKIPNYKFLKDAFIQKGIDFDKYFEFEKQKKVEDKNHKLLDYKLVTSIKKFCAINNITTKHLYKNCKNKPDNFPSSRLISNLFGDDYYTKVLGLKIYADTFEDKLQNELLKNEIKVWCKKNQIDSLNKYKINVKPKNFPTLETIRRRYGFDFFSDIFTINKRHNQYYNLEQTREICLLNGIKASIDYKKFCIKFNQQNEIKIPTDIQRFFKLKWSEFIAPNML